MTSNLIIYNNCYSLINKPEIKFFSIIKKNEELLIKNTDKFVLNFSKQKISETNKIINKTNNQLIEYDKKNYLVKSTNNLKNKKITNLFLYKSNKVLNFKVRLTKVKIDDYRLIPVVNRKLSSSVFYETLLTFPGIKRPININLDFYYTKNFYVFAGNLFNSKKFRKNRYIVHYYYINRYYDYYREYRKNVFDKFGLNYSNFVKTVWGYPICGIAFTKRMRKRHLHTKFIRHPFFSIRIGKKRLSLKKRKKFVLIRRKVYLRWTLKPPSRHRYWIAKWGKPANIKRGPDGNFRMGDIPTIMPSKNPWGHYIFGKEFAIRKKKYFLTNPSPRFLRYRTDYIYYRYFYLQTNVFREINRKQNIVAEIEYWKEQKALGFWGRLWRRILDFFIRIKQWILSFFHRPHHPPFQSINLMWDFVMTKSKFPLRRARIKFLKFTDYAIVIEWRKNISDFDWFSIRCNKDGNNSMDKIYLVLDTQIYDLKHIHERKIDEKSKILLTWEHKKSSNNFITSDFLYNSERQQKAINYCYSKYINPKFSKKNFPILAKRRNFKRKDYYGFRMYDYYKQGKLNLPSYSYDERRKFLYKFRRGIKTFYVRNILRKLKKDQYNTFYPYPQINKYGKIKHNYPYPQKDSVNRLIYPCPYIDQDGIIIYEKKFYNWNLFYPYFYPRAEKKNLITPQQYWLNQHIWIKKYLSE